MKNVLLKDTAKEIKVTFKRFLSILLVVLLGVGFFAGIKATSPDMKKTIDEYFDSQNVMDIEVISTLGLTDDDVKTLQNVEGVEKVSASYYQDAIVQVEDAEYVMRMEGIADDINTLVLVEGNMPNNVDECVVEEGFLKTSGYKIGDKINLKIDKITDDDGNEKDAIKQNNLKIVGTVKSPLYISRERGSSKLGSGKINYFMYVNRDLINSEYYVVAYIQVNGAKELKCYKDDYDKLIDNVKNKIEEIEEERKQARYNDIYNKANEKIQDAAEEKLEDAKLKLKDIKKPEWYILDRNQNNGYASYMQDTDRIANLATVFPVVFFVVAALISLTSMTRMVEEERVQIGTLKALGYTKLQIASKYIIYALLATIIGSAVGLVIGFNLLPKIITDMYAMMYVLPNVTLEFNIEYTLISVILALLCTVGATIYSCTKSLLYEPAELMRPKAPKPGKRVFLENIKWLWSKLKFTEKVTARNIFRYKKRFLMTIIGVMGCTALILTGFGIRDAISKMIPSQYGEIFKYNLQVSLKDNITKKQIEDEDNFVKNLQGISETIKINLQSIDITSIENTQNIQLIVPEDTEKFRNFVSLKSRTKKNESYILDNEGVIITEKLAKLLNIKVGDAIKIKNNDDIEVETRVSHITENYLMHYIYMSKDLYESLYNEEFKANTIYANISDLNRENEIGEEILHANDLITGIVLTSSTENVFSEVMENMNFVVWILIISAGLLAFVVLYNLANTNISERIRELATIKVLGFYDREVYDYISKETRILTVIGMILGLFAGYFLTMFIIKTCELDLMMFSRSINSISFVYALIITVVFSIIVEIATYFALKKIDMIESLKSIE